MNMIHNTKSSAKLIGLQTQQAKLQEKNFAAQLARQRLKDITELLSDNKIEIIDENMMKNLLENIKVISKHEIEFQFKCGINATEKV